ncbi:sensor histidine kinase KdpD [Pedobacter sp. SYSU D00535]|uniref:sensor histidine kinase n=1 Tax=Pedobacter sp. SYSU D00535 TaxID=2810308 RepID=UPI001A956BDA|nr:HAMP domain-containing sensor histidine kinase [Pedobacter sp. SYSU D00535]
MESRIFNTVCITTAASLLVSAIFTAFIGVPDLAFLMLAVVTLVFIFYYISRFKNKTSYSIMLYALLSNVFLVVNYYLNSGIEGPTLLISLLAIFLILAIAPTTQNWIWIGLNIVVVSGLLILDYSYPGLVENTYPSEQYKYWDLGFSYTVIVLLIFLVTRYIRNSYLKERSVSIRKTAELEAVNETKNKLFSILAHDFSAPLSSIQGYLEASAEISLNQEEKQWIEKELLNKTRYTSAMLANLLYWTRSQMDGLKVVLAPVDIAAVLAEILVVQRPLAEDKAIKIGLEIEEQLVALADKDMIQLVLRNLINNAIKFSFLNSLITIRTSLSDDMVQISVSDQGVGITPDLQESLFSLKVKSSKGTKNEKGAGLGLVLCKEFTELQNGAIMVNSTAKKGTTFTISLPTPRG